MFARNEHAVPPRPAHKPNCARAREVEEMREGGLRKIGKGGNEEKTNIRAMIKAVPIRTAY